MRIYNIMKLVKQEKKQYKGYILAHNICKTIGKTNTCRYEDKPKQRTTNAK